MNDINKLELKKTIWDVVEFINSIFIDAINNNASDIHIESLEDFMLVRFRQDWDFFIKMKVWVENISAIITRLKVLSKVKIDENKKPQDWKIVFNYTINEDKKEIKKFIDMRSSFLPTTYWEKVVLRLLKQDKNLTNIDDLGLIPINLNKVREAIKSKYWIILVAGPTWSGKSTSLLWILKDFNPLDHNISTLEDPVEYNIDFVNQSQIKPEIWYTFASWLRSLVRQDPDIIMVWEIRDKETSLLSIEAALTWHLVLSTIHTNSAAWTIQRLINMWIEPFLVASALKMVISQRLVKSICTECKKEVTLDEISKTRIKKELWNLLSETEIETLKFFKWTWCPKCNDTWYKWRIWIHEVMNVNEDIEKWILKIDSVSKLHITAQNNWMITIMQDALIKASMWKTTIEEAFTLI